MAQFHWNLAIASGLMGSLISGLSLINSPAARGQTLPRSSPAVDSAPAAQLDQLLYFQGTWQCRARPAKAPNTQPFARYTWSVKRTLNNYWFLGNVTAADRTELAHDTLGFNTLSNKFGRTVLTADGGFYNFLSDGWDGDTFIWEGSAVDMGSRTKRALREVLVRKSNQQFEAVFYTQDPTSKAWIAETQEICDQRSPSFVPPSRLKRPSSPSKGDR